MVQCRTQKRQQPFPSLRPRSVLSGLRLPIRRINCLELLTLLPLLVAGEPATAAIAQSLQACCMAAPGSLSQAELTAGLVAAGKALAAGTESPVQSSAISHKAAAAVAATLSVSRVRRLQQIFECAEHEDLIAGVCLSRLNRLCRIRGQHQLMW
jgi:hypothetical protein